MKTLKIGSLFVALLVLVFSSASWAGEAFDAVTTGKSCSEDDQQMITCEYKIGNNLHISIPGIGMPDTAVTFFKSDWDGDFYASFGIMHQCVIVKHGKSSHKKDPDIGKLTDLAFISPKNGKVYEDWESCAKGF